MQKVRRDVLKKKVEAGLMEAKCEYHMTDDYLLDNANGFGKTGWIPARLQQNFDDFVTDQMNLKAHDFKSKVGTAYKNSDGTITFIVHSNLAYTLREKA